MTTRYDAMQNRFNNTKPIRGRAEDVRPIGERRRDWERIVKEERADGTWYGARLYQTNVVMFGPQGQIELSSGGWATPSTAAFMSDWSPFVVAKRERNLWASVGNHTYMIPHDTPLKFQNTVNGYVALNPPTLKQRVVNRTAVAEMRKRIKPFVDFVTTMLKLSDGWVMASTLDPYEVKDATRSWRPQYDFLTDGNGVGILGDSHVGILNMLRGSAPNTDPRVNRWMAESTREEWDRTQEQTLDLLATEDTEMWQRIMYEMLNSIEPINQRVVREVEMSNEHQQYPYKYTRKYYDRQYSVGQFKRRIDKILQNHSQARAERVVEGNKVRKGLIG